MSIQQKPDYHFVEENHRCRMFNVSHITNDNKCKDYSQPGTIIAGSCKKTPVSGSHYCDIHIYIESFSPNDWTYLRYCVKCHRLFKPDFNNVKRTCFGCREKAKDNKKHIPKKLCKFVNPLRSLNCSSTVQPGTEYCLYHQRYNGLDLNDLCWHYIKGCYNAKTVKDFCQSCSDFMDRTMVLTSCQLNQLNVTTIEELCDKNFECVKCLFIGHLNYFLDSNNNLNLECLWCRPTEEMTLTKNLENMNILLPDEYVLKIRHNIKCNGIPIKLTDLQIKNLVNLPCFYCGTKPDSTYNTIDLLNNKNKEGFIAPNTVTVCWTCKRTKSGFQSGNDFTRAIMNITNKNVSSDSTKPNEVSFLYSNLNDFKSANPNFNIQINENDYMHILQNGCYYCNSLNSNILTIGRKEMTIHFTFDNSFAICTVCNQMKGEMDSEYFENFIEHIMIHQHNKSHIAKAKLKKIPTVITKEWLLDRLSELSDFLKVSENVNLKQSYIDNRASNFKPLHGMAYYKKLVYSKHDVDNFFPEIEFVENETQHDLWNYFRLKMSSLKQSVLVGHQIKMLIRDKNTQTYIGIASLSSDVKHLETRDKYIGWTVKNKFTDKRLNCILNLSTCVGLRPFCYNFNGGKLIAKLMFSKEVYDYVSNKYPNLKLVGILTTSINGKSIQYSCLPELKFIGYSKGYGTIHIPDIYLGIIDKYFEQNCEPSNTKPTKMYRLNKISKELGLGDSLVNHGKKRGVYFGYLCEGAKEYLCGSDNVELKYDLKTIETIYENWKKDWAIPRFNHLVQNDRLLNNVEFNNNCILTNGDLRYNRVIRSRSKQKDSPITEEEIEQKTVCFIIRSLQKNRYISTKTLESNLREIGLDKSHQSIGRLIKKYNLDSHRGNLA